MTLPVSEPSEGWLAWLLAAVTFVGATFAAFGRRVRLGSVVRSHGHRLAAYDRRFEKTDKHLASIDKNVAEIGKSVARIEGKLGISQN